VVAVSLYGFNVPYGDLELVKGMGNKKVFIFKGNWKTIFDTLLVFLPPFLPYTAAFV
jgi:hypothetical protein